jgi:hypothetical protein
MVQRRASRSWYHWPIALYDRCYRLAHGLDRPAAAVGPAVRLEIRRSRRTIRLADGEQIEAGDPIGVLHLNNQRVAALHDEGSSPMTIGIRSRRLFLASLGELARGTSPGGPFVGVRAFTATTIFHRALGRFGFEPAREAARASTLAALYHRALLATLHPAGASRLSAETYHHARRIWISRERLCAMYGATPAEVRTHRPSGRRRR